MRSTFFGIETMRRALLTQRKVMDTIGHNVANANTPGYSRQQVHLTTTSPYPYPSTTTLYGAGQIGTGVIADAIERVRDVFIDKQLRMGTTDKGQNEIEKSILSQIENAFMEPSTDNGLSGAMGQFFNAWQELSKRPENLAARNQVISMANNVVDVIHNIDQTLRNIRVDLNGQLQKDVTEVNRILHEIAYLNPEIAKVYTQGNTPNDLLDKRDSLFDELSNYVNFNVSDGDFTGIVNVAIGGRVLIQDEHVYELNLDMTWDHPSQNTKTPYMNDVSQDDYNMLAQFSSGELKGIINSRDQILIDAQNQFTDLINTFVNTVNNYHSQGMGTNLDDTGSVASTTSAITNMSNFVTVAATDVKYFNVGETLYIRDAQGEAVTVKLTGIDTTNNRLYFDNVGTLNKAQEGAASTYSTTPFAGGGVDTGAEIRKITREKENFFTLQDILGNNLVGDTNPDYFSQKMSTIQLPEQVTLQTTVGQLEALLGVDITNNINGLRLQLDNQSYSKTITDNTTLDTLLLRLSQENLVGNDGKGLQFKFDEVNRRITVTGQTREALDQLGGPNGSACNLLRVLGLEGYGITGSKNPAGTQLSAQLKDLGVGNGYIQIDNVVIELNDTWTLQSALDTINTALNKDPSQKSYGTNVFFDPTSGRVRIVSPHRFSVATPEISQFPASGTATTTSNFLTVLGLQREETNPTDAMVQGLTSLTSSDIGARIAINADLLNDVGKIATAVSYAGIPGDNTSALDIAGIKNQYLKGDLSTGRSAQPTLTIDDFYNDFIAQIGTDAQKANMDSDVIDKYVEYYQNQRQEVSGVSIDEEMTKMIQAQQSFAAASRMINVVDEMLTTIISSTGLAGR
jgi:flagellar hook-associated protein FlgK